MRIIAGQWRGRPITAPPGDATRPTADRVREAVFSMLASRLGSFDELRVADLFAGSGALGLEALSRGAAHCTFVERDREARRALEQNIAVLNASANIQSRAVENIAALSDPCDLIFMDPPYGKALTGKILHLLTERNWIAPGCWISVETERDAAVDGEDLAVDTVRTFGKAQITLFRAATR